jgi:hypothetical protein
VEYHPTVFGAVRAVHVIPSGDVMIRWAAVPLIATAQNKPSCGDQHTLVHAPALGAVRAIHVTPSGLVMICWSAVPVNATAQKSPN